MATAATASLMVTSPAAAATALSPVATISSSDGNSFHGLHHQLMNQESERASAGDWSKPWLTAEVIMILPAPKTSFPQLLCSILLRVARL